MPRSFTVAPALLALAVLAAPAAPPVAPPPSPKRLPVAPMPHEPGEELLPNLTDPDPGLDLKLDPTLPDLERLDLKTVDEKVTNDLIGQPNVLGLPEMPGKLAHPAGLGVDDFAGRLGARADDAKGPLPGPFASRTGATKEKLLQSEGGTKESEKAVARGLAWIAKQQQADGGWKFDAGQKEERACATGLALLPFLAAGVTHKKKEEKEFKGYDAVVQKGLQFLMKTMPLSGASAGRLSTDVYANAIAALPLVEAYGMTKDPALKPFAQAAVNYLQRTQGPNGSWGYGNTGNGDTSIVGWQVQVLKTAQLTKDLVVDDRVIQKAVKFLDLTAAGDKKSKYGYNDNTNAQPGTALTAIGLLCRYYLDGWGPAHPGLTDGVAGLMKNAPPAKGGVKNLYYFYYASQVVHNYGGNDWQTWNEGAKNAEGKRAGGMRDWLVSEQITKDGADLGSWNPEQGWFGTSCGRLGTTAMCVLNLEVYYRHAPLYKRAPDDKK